MPRIQRVLSRLLLASMVLALLAAVSAWWLLSGSLPRLDGELAVPGLDASVTVQRDALGTVTIRAGNETDAARALGFVHAQERFFEMDLLRRSAAGELSALFGPVALEKDKSVRVHRLRARAANSIRAVAGDKLPVLQAYTDGVNAGLSALRTRPWPYLLLAQAPRPWQPVDTALVGYAMFFDLQDESNSRELALWRIRGVVPDALYRLIAADGTRWDAPMIGSARVDVVLPTAAELDLRALPAPQGVRLGEKSEPAAPGSNNFAVDRALTRDGRAILANDMHLGLRAPNIWFRARLVYADPAAPRGIVDVSGFTLPGTPAVVVGSNRSVAWGFTNAYGDWLDFVQVDWLDAAHSRYRLGSGEARVVPVTERIQVKGGRAIDFIVRETRWGPVTQELGERRSLALRWTAHQPGALNLALSGLASAANIDQALDVAGVTGMPAQNLLLADSSGRIAWRMTAQMPRRSRGCDPSAPLDPVRCDWLGTLAAAANPSMVDPASHRLWTANARVVDGDALRLIGDSGYANGARARQIRDALFASQRFSERDLLAVQLDDRALFLARWHALLREHARGEDPAWKAIEAATRRWEGRASPEAVAYGVVRDYRRAIIERIRDGLLAPAMARLGDDFIAPDLPQIEGVAWQLATQRPPHLLPRRFRNWDELFLEAARSVAPGSSAALPAQPRNWGERNRAAICHPLANALPGPLRGWLCMPDDALAGDLNMPRIASPTFGASERMVVSPGHEEDGIIHMPGGQSGHPMSPFWGAGHVAWVEGKATPFLPGATTHELTMTAR